MEKFKPDHELFKLSLVTDNEMNKIIISDYSLSYNVCMYDLWYYKLRNLRTNKKKQLKKNLLPKLDVNKSPCKHCIKGKMIRKPFQEGKKAV